jgi:Spondin_N
VNISLQRGYKPAARRQLLNMEHRIRHGAGVCQAVQELAVTNASYVLSWHSYIVSTADWFVSVHDFELCQGNKWITSARVPLFPYSQGTMDLPDCTIHSQSSGKHDLSEQLQPGSRDLRYHTNIWVDDCMCGTFCLPCNHTRALSTSSFSQCTMD